jgi:hypothetical protein
MTSLLNRRIGCVALVAVVAGLGVASAAGAGGASTVSAGAITTTHAVGAISAPAAPPSLPIGAMLLFSNFGPGNGYNCCTGWTVSEPGAVGLFRPAMAFTPSVNAQVTQIDIALGHVSGTNNATISLAQDNGGVPGTILRTWPVALQPPFGTCCIVTTVGGSLVPVAAGHKYWVIASAGPNVANNTWDAWNLNSIGQQGPTALDTGSGFVLNANHTEGAFDVIGCGKLCKVQ